MTFSGMRVSHLQFGDGVVKSCENGIMNVLFQEYGARKFHYPQAFEHFLTTDDEARSPRMREDLCAWKLGREAENARIAQLCIDRAIEAKPVKAKAAKPKTAKPKTTKAASAKVKAAKE